MARIRSIKPEVWTDEKVVALSPLARLLFIGMWNFVDDEGRSEFSPSRLKMQILPSDSTDISELIGEIRREKLVSIYTVEGKEYFAVIGFTKHQKIDHRVKSKHPPPPKPAEFPRNVPPDQGKDQGKDQGTRKEEGGADAPAAKYVFEGLIVRVTAEHLATWRSSFHGVPDLLAELRAADAYYADNPPKDGKWFFPVSNWLKRAHEQALLAKRTEADAEARIYRGVQ